MIRWSWPTMGSMASLAVAGTATPAARAELAAAVRVAQDWLEEVEAALSPYRTTSDLCRWRAGDAALAQLSPLLGDVVAVCTDLQVRTGGGFHPFDRSGQYDPSGYVKGWAVEAAMRVLAEAGVTDACLGVGGDVAMRGTSDEGRPWRAAIGDPRDGRRIVAVLEQPAGGQPFAVATSGAAQRGAHIWGAAPAGPRPPRPAVLASVTVVGPELGRVDAFATAVWARARREPLAQAWAWLAGTGCEALALTNDGTVHLTEGMPAYLYTPVPAASAAVAARV